jgi:hypothetical protein
VASWHQHWGWQARRSLVPQPPVVESCRGWSTCLWGVHHREQGTSTGVRSPYPHTRPPISTKSLPSLDRFAYTMHFFSSFCIHLTRQEQNQCRKKSASCRMRLKISKWWSGFRQQTTRLNKLQQRKLHGLDWYFISRQHGACIYILRRSSRFPQGAHGRQAGSGSPIAAIPHALCTSLVASAALAAWWPGLRLSFAPSPSSHLLLLILLPLPSFVLGLPIGATLLDRWSDHGSGLWPWWARGLAPQVLHIRLGKAEGTAQVIQAEVH